VSEQTQQAANKIVSGPTLGDVTRPLVALMQTALSWHKRSEIALAIWACIHQWRDLEHERLLFERSQSCGSVGPQA
jgi:hypothetical protein